MKRYLDHEETLRENILKIYGLVIGQCSPALRSALRGDPEYKNKSQTFDTKWLLEKLKKITAGVDLKANPVLSLHEQTLAFFTMHQGISETDEDYLSLFNSRSKKFRISRRRTHVL